MGHIGLRVVSIVFENIEDSVLLLVEVGLVVSVVETSVVELGIPTS